MPGGQHSKRHTGTHKQPIGTVPPLTYPAFVSRDGFAGQWFGCDRESMPVQVAMLQEHGSFHSANLKADRCADVNTSPYRICAPVPNFLELKAVARTLLIHLKAFSIPSLPFKSLPRSASGKGLGNLIWVFPRTLITRRSTSGPNTLARRSLRSSTRCHSAPRRAVNYGAYSTIPACNELRSSEHLP